MRPRRSIPATLTLLGVTLGIAVTTFSASIPPSATMPGSWSTTAAARSMDARQTWWMNWPTAHRDHQTACISCHTAVPYAMARPTLRHALGESAPSAPEQVMLGYILKRVKLWDQVQPFYSNEDTAPGKTPESRGTESVLNALVLVRYDEPQGHLSATTRRALANMWATQLTTRTALHPGEAGSWAWLNFQLAPWESNEAHYYGATLAAIAVGLTPRQYQSSPAIQPQLQQLTHYLVDNYGQQPLVNRITLLWASTRLPALLPPAKRTALLDDIRAHQQPDGGWSLASLGQWKRQDKTPLDAHSDGYATGLTVYALHQAGISNQVPELQKAITWLTTHQDNRQGLWPAASLNAQRDPSSDIGRFMSDAATGYSVMALEAVQP